MHFVCRLRTLLFSLLVHHDHFRLELKQHIKCNSFNTIRIPTLIDFSLALISTSSSDQVLDRLLLLLLFSWYVILSRVFFFSSRSRRTLKPLMNSNHHPWMTNLSSSRFCRSLSSFSFSFSRFSRSSFSRRRFSSFSRSFFSLQIINSSDEINGIFLKFTLYYVITIFWQRWVGLILFPYD